MFSQLQTSQRVLFFHFPFSKKFENPGSILLQYSLRMLWEWIAATVQATHWHLAVELNTGGLVAAISVSTVHASHNTPGSRAHFFAVWCDSNKFPPIPHPKCFAQCFCVFFACFSEVDQDGGERVHGTDAHIFQLSLHAF